MKPVKSIAAIVLATLMALSMVACTGTPATASAPAESASAAAAESAAASAEATAATGDNNLNVMVEVEVASLDPQIATDGTSFEVIADYTDGLMQMDDKGTAVPAIAKSVDVSADGKTYTFHLRDDAKIIGQRANCMARNFEHQIGAQKPLRIGHNQPDVGDALRLDQLPLQRLHQASKFQHGR